MRIKYKIKKIVLKPSIKWLCTKIVLNAFYIKMIMKQNYTV